VLKTGAPYLIGADAGTSSCKTILMDQRGNILANAQIGYTTDFPREGWAEQDPEDWYRALVQGVRQCIGSAHVPAEEIVALSVCGPAHNVVLLDGDDHVLQPVILWSDRRSISQAEWLEQEYGSRVYAITYQPVNPSWSLAQLLWTRQNRSEIWKRVRRIVIGKDYLSYRLTGSWRTDWYDAMGTQMFDARTGEWSSVLCRALDLPLERLPPVGDAVAVSGRVTPSAAKDTGLTSATLVAVGSGDSVVEALSAGVVEPGQCIVKLGTAGNVNVVTARPRPSEGTLTYRHVMPRRWYTIAATNSGTGSVTWFCDIFDIAKAMPRSESLPAMERLAGRVAPGSEGLIFHPYLQGERCPYWDPALRGDFVGITLRHQRQHFARAVLEGVAFSLRDCLQLLRELEVPTTQFLLMGGGARSALWRTIVADVLNVELEVAPTNVTAYGAALVAGVSSGVFGDLHQAANIKKTGRESILPDPRNAATYDRLHALYRRAAQRLAHIDHALHDSTV
jgi:xylulokinase